MTTQRTGSHPMKIPGVHRVESSVAKTPGKRNLALENGDCQLSVGDKVERQTEKTRHTFLDNMDAIAYGVQARFEENTAYSRRVTETTVDIARALGIPEAEIKRWADFRLTQLIRDTEKLSKTKSLLEKLQESFLDQDDNTDTHEE